MAQVLATNYVSVLRRSSLPTWAQVPGVRKSTVTCHEGEGPGLRYRVPSICQALCEALNRGHHPESIPWQLTRWHYLHLTDEEPEAQRGKSLSKPTGQSGGAPFQEIHALPVTPAPSSAVSVGTVTASYSSTPHAPSVFKKEILHIHPRNCAGEKGHPLE